MIDHVIADWHQIVVPDPQGLSGNSVLSFMTSMMRRLGTTEVVASDIIGASSGLTGYTDRALSSEDFLQRVGEATQYDWGFFFLYSGAREDKKINVFDVKATMENADATIRLVDDEYFYVYTRDENLASELRRKYPAAEYKASTLEGLDIPS